MYCCSKYFMQKDLLTTKARKKIHISDFGGMALVCILNMCKIC